METLFGSIDRGLDFCKKKHTQTRVFSLPVDKKFEVCDATDKERIDNGMNSAKHELGIMLGYDELARDAPLLIFANKQDLKSNKSKMIRFSLLIFKLLDVLAENSDTVEISISLILFLEKGSVTFRSMSQTFREHGLMAKRTCSCLQDHVLIY